MSEEVKSRLRWEPSMLPRAVAMSEPGLLLEPIAGLMSLMQPRSVLTSEAPIPPKTKRIGLYRFGSAHHRL